MSNWPYTRSVLELARDAFRVLREILARRLGRRRP